MKKLLIILLLLIPSLAWGGMIMRGFDDRDVYIFSNNTTGWTLGSGTTWTNPTITMARVNQSGSFAHTTLVHQAGIVTIEYYKTCGGSCSWGGPTVNGVFLSLVSDQWATVSAYVPAGTGLEFLFYTASTATSFQIRKIWVPKP